MNNPGYLLHHEIGHALGLKHAHLPEHDNNSALAKEWNSHEFSVTTYYSRSEASNILLNGLTADSWSDGHFPQSYMMLDIAALQYMYGADYSTNAGNTTYRFSPSSGEMFVNGVSQGVPVKNIIFRSIWDGDGVDTYDLSNYTSAVTIDLRPGEWTTTSKAQLANLGDGHFAQGNIANARLYKDNIQSLIENAVGGAGDDTIRGNQANNKLDGGPGNDTLTGGPGADIFVLSAGKDVITDFNPGEGDRIQLPAGQTVRDVITVVGGDLTNQVLTHAGGTLTLLNPATKSSLVSLDPNWFVTAPGGSSPPQITKVEQFHEAGLIYARLYYTDPDNDAVGYGFHGIKGAGWAPDERPFTNPGYARVSPGYVEIPFNLLSGTASAYDSDVAAYIVDAAGHHSAEVDVHLIA